MRSHYVKGESNSKMWRGKKETALINTNNCEVHANKNRSKMIDNYKRIVNQDCYGCQKRRDY